jgi:Cof subfamily protein (haloacid dehalogenase superfamily)
VLDLDGTCLDDQQNLHPRIRECVRRATQRLPVVVATGRMYRSALPWARELGTQAPLVCYQGAVVREFSANETMGDVLYACELGAPAAVGALLIAREHGWHFNAYQNEELLCEQDRPEAHLYARIANVPINFVADLEPVLQRGVAKAICVIEDPHEAQRCIATLKTHLDGTARVTQSLPQFVEIVNPSVSKAIGARLALEHMNASLQRSVAIGDAPNDIEMLDAAGFSVAVKGAAATVVDAASAVCAVPQEGGVADVLEALCLC